ncbi:unnamed protein product [Amoebophrya sp. A25]|nr:unnamed protein product [Amoebophrya sp. A25]|eukprot:GSA25T00001955001.1
MEFLRSLGLSRDGCFDPSPFCDLYFHVHELLAVTGEKAQQTDDKQVSLLVRSHGFPEDSRRFLIQWPDERSVFLGDIPKDALLLLQIWEGKKPQNATTAPTAGAGQTAVKLLGQLSFAVSEELCYMRWIRIDKEDGAAGGHLRSGEEDMAVWRAQRRSMISQSVTPLLTPFESKDLAGGDIDVENPPFVTPGIVLEQQAAATSDQVDTSADSVGESNAGISRGASKKGMPSLGYAKDLPTKIDAQHCSTVPATARSCVSSLVVHPGQFSEDAAAAPILACLSVFPAEDAKAHFPLHPFEKNGEFKARAWAPLLEAADSQHTWLAALLREQRESLSFRDGPDNVAETTGRIMEDPGTCSTPSSPIPVVIRRSITEKSKKGNRRDLPPGQANDTKETAAGSSGTSKESSSSSYADCTDGEAEAVEVHSARSDGVRTRDPDELAKTRPEANVDDSVSERSAAEATGEHATNLRRRVVLLEGKLAQREIERERLQEEFDLSKSSSEGLVCGLRRRQEQDAAKHKTEIVRLQQVVAKKDATLKELLRKSNVKIDEGNATILKLKSERDRQRERADKGDTEREKLGEKNRELLDIVHSLYSASEKGGLALDRSSIDAFSKKWNSPPLILHHSAAENSAETPLETSQPGGAVVLPPVSGLEDTVIPGHGAAGTGGGGVAGTQFVRAR